MSVQDALDILGLKDRQDLVMLQEVVSVVEGGRADIRGRHELFTNPKTPETATNLTDGQVSMCASFLFVGLTFPEFECATEIVHQIARMNLSRGGWSVEKANESYQLAETKMQRGLSVISNTLGSAIGGKSE